MKQRSTMNKTLKTSISNPAPTSVTVTPRSIVAIPRSRNKNPKHVIRIINAPKNRIIVAIPGKKKIEIKNPITLPKIENKNVPTPRSIGNIRITKITARRTKITVFVVLLILSPNML